MKHTILLFIALIFALNTSPSTLCNGLMRKLKSETTLSLMCRKTSDFGFCVYTLESDPRSKGASIDGLANIALDKLGGHAKDTETFLQGLLNGAKGNIEKEVIETCISAYKVAVDKDIPAAMTSLNGKVYGAAKQAANAAMNDGQECQGEVTKNPSAKWQALSGRNNYMHDLSQLSSDLIGLIV